ncbi:hypothetical protein GIB67_019363 [Kingdonia uniflora]|uniref:Uncharacterized protein n=1 Tax=Kingdonia uniflora TaxID=39325 RepID=A0A7J7M1K1_9MAGN|nr:hypothetical protein GIB67_019363 [Kingdonia uniflora]
MRCPLDPVDTMGIWDARTVQALNLALPNQRRCDAKFLHRRLRAGIETYCGYVSRVSREIDIKYAKYRAACDNALYGIGVAIEDIKTLRFSNSTKSLNQELRGQLLAAHARVRELFAHINSLAPMDMQKEIYMGEPMSSTSVAIQKAITKRF